MLNLLLNLSQPSNAALFFPAPKSQRLGGYAVLAAALQAGERSGALSAERRRLMTRRDRAAASSSPMIRIRTGR